MNFVWIMALAVLGVALQTTKDTKVTKKTKGPSSPATAGSARDDKNKNKNDAPPLAVLGRGDNSEFADNRVQHSYVQRIHASADRVFAVLEPVEEVKWAPGFEFEWVYAKEGAQAKSGQEGDVFVTRHVSGLGSQSTAIWVISRRDVKEKRVQFVRTVPELAVTQIDIHVVPDGERSKCEITYTYTALSDHGREQLRQMTREHYEAQMKEWEEQVNAYLSRS